MNLPFPLERLIDELSKLPSIGRKSARRLAFAILEKDQVQAVALANAIQSAKAELTYCKQCFSLSEDDLCHLCEDSSRNDKIIMVVEDAKNVFSIESAAVFHGHYHVLGGAIHPIRGIGPDQLKISELEIRIERHEIDELILATNPTLEGEATAHYLTDLFKSKVPKVSRIARGMPSGGDLEFTDQHTLARAIEGRSLF